MAKASTTLRSMKSSQPCSECGTPFACECASGACWCNDYLVIMTSEFPWDCRCPSCLAKAIGRTIEARLTTLPLADAVMLAKQQPASGRLLEHIDYTIEKGSYVFSRWYLLKQGKCCGNGCRNCPYIPKH